MAVGFIREILHLDWLANLVLVQKKNTNEWRMCVDYTDLNKHCLKDPFRLPRIDQIVDSTAGSALLSFLDCYSGYHQITLKEQDIFHYSVRCLLLQDHVVWTQECWCHIPKSYPNMPRWSDRWKRRGIHGWHSSKNKEPGHTNWILKANLWKPEKVEVKTKPKQVCIHGSFRTTTRILG